MKGSDIRLIREGQHFINTKLMPKVIVEPGIEIITDYFVKFEIPFIFANYGNKSGVVTSLKLSGDEKPEDITNERLEIVTQDTIPITIDAKDCIAFNYRIKWGLDPKLQNEIFEGNERIVETTKRIEWAKTVHKGLIRQKVEVQSECSEIKIVCRMYGTQLDEEE